MHVQARAWGALERIVARYERHTEPTIAVVSHGDVVRGLLLLLLGMPLDHIHRLEVAPASVSEVLLGAGQPKIRTINQSYGVDSFSSVSTSQGNRSYPNPQSPQ